MTATLVFKGREFTASTTHCRCCRRWAALQPVFVYPLARHACSTLRGER